MNNEDLHWRLEHTTNKILGSPRAWTPKYTDPLPQPKTIPELPYKAKSENLPKDHPSSSPLQEIEKNA